MPASRQAPAFQLDVPPDPALSAVVAAVAALAGAGLCGWAASWAGSDGLTTWARQAAWMGAGLAVMAACAWLGWRSMQHPVWRLRWDGQAWWLHEGGANAERAVLLRPVMDLGNWMLLQLRPVPEAGAWWRAVRTTVFPSYLALSRRGGGSRWPLLRATLYAARTEPTSTPEGGGKP